MPTGTPSRSTVSKYPKKISSYSCLWQQLDWVLYRHYHLTTSLKEKDGGSMSFSSSLSKDSGPLPQANIFYPVAPGRRKDLHGRSHLRTVQAALIFCKSLPSPPLVAQLKKSRYRLEKFWADMTICKFWSASWIIYSRLRTIIMQCFFWMKQTRSRNGGLLSTGLTIAS